MKLLQHEETGESERNTAKSKLGAKRAVFRGDNQSVWWLRTMCSLLTHTTWLAAARTHVVYLKLDTTMNQTTLYCDINVVVITMIGQSGTCVLLLAMVWLEWLEYSYTHSICIAPNTHLLRSRCYTLHNHTLWFFVIDDIRI